MKRFFLISGIIFLVLSVNGQVRQEVIASAGGNNVNGALSISWTLGETIVPTFKSQDGTIMLTHGFQQKLIVTVIEENLDFPVTVNIYPNPASEVVNIQFDAPLAGDMDLMIIDSNGSLIRRDKIESSLIEKQINLQGVPAGVYYLRLVKGKTVNVYKVVKL